MRWKLRSVSGHWNAACRRRWWTLGAYLWPLIVKEKFWGVPFSSILTLVFPSLCICKREKWLPSSSLPSPTGMFSLPSYSEIYWTGSACFTRGLRPVAGLCGPSVGAPEVLCQIRRPPCPCTARRRVSVLCKTSPREELRKRSCCCCRHRQVAQVCPSLCGPRDGSPPGSAVPGSLQATTLEWVAISFSNAWKWKVKVKLLQSCPTLCDPRDGSPPGSPSLGFSRQGYWSGLPLPSPEKTEWSHLPFFLRDTHKPTLWPLRDPRSVCAALLHSLFWNNREL